MDFSLVDSSLECYLAVLKSRLSSGQSFSRVICVSSVNLFILFRLHDVEIQIFVLDLKLLTNFLNDPLLPQIFDKIFNFTPTLEFMQLQAAFAGLALRH